MRRSPVFVVVLSVLLAVLAGCGDDEEQVGTGDDGASTTVAGDSSGDDGGEPFDGSTTPVSAPSAASGTVLLDDVRVAGHDRFDRVVFELRGDELPGWDVRYVDPPIREDGSGDEIDVDGEAFLQIRMEPASGVSLDGEKVTEVYRGPDRVTGGGTSVVREVVDAGDFEANLTWVVALRQRVAFRVDTLRAPTRLVIDLETS